MRRIGGAIAVGVILVGAALAYALLRPAERPGYSNQVINQGGAAFIPPGETYCQRDEAIPADARSVRLFVGTDDPPAGPLVLVIRDMAGNDVAGGRSPGTFSTGPLDIPIEPRPPSIGSAFVCLRLEGSAVVSIGGSKSEKRGGGAPPGFPLVRTPGAVRDSAQPGRIRLEYAGLGRRSALSAAPTVMDRAALVKASVFDDFVIWLALLATVGVGVAAVVSVVRTAE